MTQDNPNPTARIYCVYYTYGILFCLATVRYQALSPREMKYDGDYDCLIGCPLFADNGTPMMHVVKKKKV